ncbi:hypothetical protein PR202_gb21151 [Eleusine coracana subsp. coracana]|uniref:Bifunctional inhibitor/plant lipid transfer protein/seed storage helical domain-containing protein n=1 Tax=Eleusine coracana subsp. coracana TaxID=191504 RepID=A0AAV5FE11_ELECO|nr:hypothetical protein PR202_gb21151 [Eleusine coracana subsp. coracana]
MGPTAALLLVLAVATAPAHASSAPPPAESAQDAAARCAAAIVSISPCLPHVAVGAPPSTPTDACCVAFLRAVSPSGGGGGEGCLCHLLRDPLLLGFPVDAARLGALLPACAAGNSFAAATVETATLFADACRGERFASPPCPFVLSRRDSETPCDVRVASEYCYWRNAHTCLCAGFNLTALLCSCIFRLCLCLCLSGNCVCQR